MFLPTTKMITRRAPESGGCRTLRAALAMLLIVPLTAGLIGGCGSSNSTAAYNGAAVSSAENASGLTLTLSQNSSTIAVGQSVSYTLTVTNTSNSSVTYVPDYTPDGPSIIPGNYSFVTVTNNIGTAPVQIPGLVYTGTNTTSFGSPVTLAPGATLTGTVGSGTTINQPGVYSATATLYIEVNTPQGQETPGNATLLTAGPLALTVR